ncbi:tetratricopeptide repeat protein [Zoogloea sp.]|uniref:O-linked N-acetylglucosamine transferase, SPINDLY family protein n=1 Tax=Zoogloea sp. TaxID=49181 RepID=UPI0025ED10F0|nr:tetratricopeptide repeat protein [Zoogloea sp.]MCK6392590.1 tetratricopeptide repeat protein [Zoogloea sp.]
MKPTVPFSTAHPAFLRWQQACASARHADCLLLAEEIAGQWGNDGLALQLLGVSQMLMGHFLKAVPILERACALRKNDPLVWDNYGAALQHAGQRGGAARAFRRSLQLDPRAAGVWCNAATNAVQDGQPEEGLRLAARALSLDPRLPLAHVALGTAHDAAGHPADAEVAYRAALAIDPACVPALTNLGRVLQERGDNRAACTVLEKAVALSPGSVEGNANLALVCSMMGELGRSAEAYQRVLDSKPDAFFAWSGLLYCHAHDEAQSPEALFAAHRAFGEALEASSLVAAGHENVRDPERRLRIGFVSADLCEHPVARLIEPIWRTLDRGAFAIHAYFNRRGADEVSVRLRGYCDVWREVAGMSDAALSACIRSDAVDILVDLSGHTAGNRLPVFAMKPAPVQVAWIGYPGTTGLRAVDYRLVDPVVAPPGRLDAGFTEHLAYLPAMSVLERPDDLPPVAPAPFLARGAITFGSFNRMNKIGDGCLRMWARLLDEVPGARLLVGGVSDGDGERIEARCVACGLDPARVELRPRVPLAAYLEQHAEVDILLDTFPFSSGTTANYGLWMGVPTITLAGNSLQQRQCASRLHRAGLADFVAETEAEYLRIAVRRAGDAAALAALRPTIRARMQADMDVLPVEMSAALGTRLRQMWERWCAGEPPSVLR